MKGLLLVAAGIFSICGAVFDWDWRIKAMHAERFGHNVHFALAITEHDTAFNIACLDQLAQCIASGFGIIGRNFDHALRDRLGGLGGSGHFNTDRIVLEGLGELFDLLPFSSHAETANRRRSG